ncbi:MAG: 30S ribosomal protein S4e [Candidatus Hadarchaeum sp.]|uniref:30S ribosomal protein S4e n=1 Tax=Candidatus Hadarchaeum sp. TaxID=2883567 RepID=UPI003D0B4A41
MAKKGSSRHLKRYAAPRTLKLPRKSAVWTMKPAPGPHPADRAIPLRVLLRDYLAVARTAREADGAISRGEVLVDGKVRRASGFPVGFMDVVHLPALDACYRILLDHLGRLIPVKIVPSEASFKLCKIIRKQYVKGKKIQLTFHDGRNVVGDFLDYKIGDVVKISLPEQKVLERLPFKVGSIAMVTGGSNVSKVGKIAEIKTIFGPQPNIVTLENDGVTFQAPEHYIFVLGREKPAISLSVSG